MAGFILFAAHLVGDTVRFSACADDVQRVPLTINPCRRYGLLYCRWPGGWRRCCWCCSIPLGRYLAHSRPLRLLFGLLTIRAVFLGHAGAAPVRHMSKTRLPAPGAAGNVMLLVWGADSGAFPHVWQAVRQA